MYLLKELAMYLNEQRKKEEEKICEMGERDGGRVIVMCIFLVREISLN